MKQYTVDAFAEQLFEGNPAAVCVLKQWPSEALMLSIARENNLSETAFTVREGDSYKLRWFTPGGEIDLCGHATLATAFVLMNYEEKDALEIRFQTASGELIVTKKDDLYEMDFPAYQLKEVEVTDLMEEVLGVRPLEAWIDRDLVCLLESEEQVRQVRPDFQKALDLPGLLVHVTAPGETYDCVSRSFAPKMGIDEDPVCGSGHCHIVPFWARKLNQDTLVARQASARGGTLYCRLAGDRVKLAGKAVLYAISQLYV